MKTQVVYQYEVVRTNGSFTRVNIIAKSRKESEHKIKEFLSRDNKVVYDVNFIESLICVG